MDQRQQFSEFINRWQLEIFHYVYRKVNNWHDAEDIVQDTWMYYWKVARNRWKDGQMEQHPERYLFGAAKGLIRNWKEHRNHRQRSGRAFDNSVRKRLEGVIVNPLTYAALSEQYGDQVKMILGLDRQANIESR